MSKNCTHATCQGETCRREKKTKARKVVSRSSSNDHPRLLKQAQEIVNLYVRIRDKNKPCICGCGAQVEHAGHFYPAGSYSGVRFDTGMNIFGQGRNCNFFGADSAIDPNIETSLVAKFGMPAVRAFILKAEATRLYKWGRQELQEIITLYKAKIKELQKEKSVK